MLKMAEPLVIIVQYPEHFRQAIIDGRTVDGGCGRFVVVNRRGGVSDGGGTESIYQLCNITYWCTQ